MPNDSSSIVWKVWNYAHVLKNARDDFGDCVEQITCLSFLKPSLLDLSCGGQAL